MARPARRRAGQVACGGFARRGFSLSSTICNGRVRDGIAIDPHDYDRKRRAEWTRPWDDDYEEVRAESPDMFDEYDDKERAHYLALTKKAAAKHKKNAA